MRRQVNLCRLALRAGLNEGGDSSFLSSPERELQDPSVRPARAPIRLQAGRTWPDWDLGLHCARSRRTCPVKDLVPGGELARLFRGAGGRGAWIQARLRQLPGRGQTGRAPKAHAARAAGTVRAASSSLSAARLRVTGPGRGDVVLCPWLPGLTSPAGLWGRAQELRASCFLRPQRKMTPHPLSLAETKQHPLGLQKRLFSSPLI